MIECYGELKIEQIVKGWVSNLVVFVFVNDFVLIDVIVVGQCDVGIVNIYYYGCV